MEAPALVCPCGAPATSRRVYGPGPDLTCRPCLDKLARALGAGPSTGYEPLPVPASPDLPRQLRAHAAQLDAAGMPGEAQVSARLCREAASEIERLRGELARGAR